MVYIYNGWIQKSLKLEDYFLHMYWNTIPIQFKDQEYTKLNVLSKSLYKNYLNCASSEPPNVMVMEAALAQDLPQLWVTYTTAPLRRKVMYVDKLPTVEGREMCVRETATQ